MCVGEKIGFIKNGQNISETAFGLRVLCPFLFLKRISQLKKKEKHYDRHIAFDY